MANPTTHITLTCPPGVEWAFVPMPGCPVCAGELAWSDCEASHYGCARCGDCGAEFYIRVLNLCGCSTERALS